MRALAERWNGDAWRTQATPDVGASYGFMGVDRGPHNLQKVWAVGWRRPHAGDPVQPLIARITGEGWTIDPAPAPVGQSTSLEDVAVFGRDTFDAVGAVALGNATDPVTGQTEGARAPLMRALGE